MKAVILLDKKAYPLMICSPTYRFCQCCDNAHLSQPSTVQVVMRMMANTHPRQVIKSTLDRL